MRGVCVCMQPRPARIARERGDKTGQNETCVEEERTGEFLNNMLQE